MLIAIAHYADGSEEDVTGKVQFRSEKPAVATVDENGTRSPPNRTAAQ